MCQNFCSMSKMFAKYYQKALLVRSLRTSFAPKNKHTKAGNQAPEKIETTPQEVLKANTECKDVVVDKNVILNRNNHKVNALERKFLIWTNSRYKTYEEIPTYVTCAVMEKARNKVRITIVNLMMLASVIGSIVMIFSGKRARMRGETLQKRSADWHAKLKEEHKNARK